MSAAVNVPSHIKITVLSILVFCTFRNNVPSSAPDADAMTSLRITHVSVVFISNLIGVPSLGKLHKKKEPPVRLLSQSADRYDAAE